MSKQNQDLVGKRFGKLLVIEKTDERYNNGVVWKCICDCGNEFFAPTGALNAGMKVSCGCKHPANLTGKRFGKLVALEPTKERRNSRIVWKCLCDCGNYTTATSNDLLNGHTKSCGCRKKEIIAERLNKQATHQKSNTRLYRVWCGMRARCYIPSHTHYKDYGGRGITICDEWHDFENFYKWAMEAGYDENAPRGQCTIDRINVEGNYEPSNCRWADAITQANNKRKKKDTTPAD